MNFVLVNYEYPPLGGGAANATACIANALQTQNHEVTVVTSAFKEMHGVHQETAGVRVVRLAVRRERTDQSTRGEMLSYVIAAALALPHLLRTYRADGMIVFFSLPCGPLGWLAHRLTGVPYVVSLRGADVPDSDTRVSTMHALLRPLRRAALNNAIAVVANSNGLARLSERADPVAVQVIANGVDSTYFCPQPCADDGAVRFLFAGRLDAQKNLIMLLDQFAVAKRHSKQRLRLTFVGDGAQRAELTSHATLLGITDAVEWCGWLDKSGLRDAYRRSDVFLNPSLNEGLPNTVLEAMACGLPAIASRVIGNDEIVQHDETGILFDLSQPSDLAQAITQLAEDRILRERMGACALQRVREHFSWDIAAARYASLFRKE